MHQRNLPAKGKYELIAPVLSGEQTVAMAAQQGHVSTRSVERWLNHFQDKGFDGLQPRRRKDWKTPKVDNGQWQELTQALALSRPTYSWAQIHRWIASQALRRGLKAPGYPTVYRWCRALDPALLCMARQGVAHYQHQFELVHRWESQAPNALWQADHTMLDIWVQDEGGQRVRPWLTLIEDDYSRAICGYTLSTQTPGAIQIALALRHAIRPKTNALWPMHGLPNQLYTDRGRDFLSDHIEEICLRLHIGVLRARARQPRGKGKIERVFHTLNMGLLQRLPHYTKQATSPAEQPMLTLAQLDDHLETYLIHTYHQQSHQTTGQTPLIRWSENGFVPNQPTDWTLLNELLVTISKPRKVQRDGIRFKRFRYLSTTLAAYVGESVTIRYDPKDMAQIRVYYRDEFLCSALCQLLTGQVVSLKEITQVRNRVRTQRRMQIQQAQQRLTSLETDLIQADVQPPIVADHLTEDCPLLPMPVTPDELTPGLKLYRYGHRH
ncbi:DDE-type integrase/transposase/recombinase (plasmid) [Fibrella sp. USSR17]